MTYRQIWSHLMKRFLPCLSEPATKGPWGLRGDLCCLLKTSQFSDLNSYENRMNVGVCFSVFAEWGFKYLPFISGPSLHQHQASYENIAAPHRDICHSSSPSKRIQPWPQTIMEINDENYSFWRYLLPLRNILLYIVRPLKSSIYFYVF